VDRFHLLKPALGLVLAFVGFKMTWHWWRGSPLLPVSTSLGIVLGMVLLGIVVSLLVPPKARSGAAEG
jgi:tellurite resistance protein TerC